MAQRFTKRSANIGKISLQFLHNRFVLYFIFFLAIANLFIFVLSNDLKSVGVFLLVGLLTSFFSKNMVVIMVVSMVVTNVIRIGSNSRDGFKGDEEDEEDAFGNAEDEEEEDAFKNAEDEEEDVDAFRNADEEEEED